MAATQGDHHVIHLICSMPPPSERRTSQPYGGYSTSCQMLSTILAGVWTSDLLLGSPARNC